MPDGLDLRAVRQLSTDIRTLVDDVALRRHCSRASLSALAGLALLADNLEAVSVPPPLKTQRAQPPRGGRK